MFHKNVIQNNMQDQYSFINKEDLLWIIFFLFDDTFGFNVPIYLC